MKASCGEKKSFWGQTEPNPTQPHPPRTNATERNVTQSNPATQSNPTQLNPVQANRNNSPGLWPMGVLDTAAHSLSHVSFVISDPWPWPRDIEPRRSSHRTSLRAHLAGNRFQSKRKRVPQRTLSFLTGLGWTAGCAAGWLLGWVAGWLVWRAAVFSQRKNAPPQACKQRRHGVNKKKNSLKQRENT